MSHFEKKDSYSYEEIMICSEGKMFGSKGPQLPSPNMLMIDRITNISEQNGSYKKGFLSAELDIKSDIWFFDCHFKGDPVMPGCLGLDAQWQLLGFYLGWLGNQGHGRALGCEEVKFSGEVLPSNSVVRYELNIRRIIVRSMILGIADGSVFADDQLIYQAKGLRVGLFDKALNIDNTD